MGNRMLVIGPGELTQTIHRIVEENNDENVKALSGNVAKAARHARDELKSPSVHVDKGGSYRGKTSMSGGKTSLGTYDSGWFVYGRSKKRYMISRVVANKHIPKLTHLLELGHSLVWMGRPTERRVPGDHAIRMAYLNAAPIARGGM